MSISGSGIGSWSDAQILAAIRGGTDDEGAALCSAMPRFVVSEDDAQALVAYLKSLPPVKRAIPASECAGN